MEKAQNQIKAIEEEIRQTPYHKGTEHHIGKLRAKLAKLRDQILEEQRRKRGGSSGFGIRQQGDATVVLVGFPSVGKSTLLNRLTNASSRVAPYAFTTVSVVPGMMEYKGARIQILDVPGLIAGAAAGRGRGQEVLSVVRSADLLVLLAQAASFEEEFKLIETELYESGVRLNQEPPKVFIKKTGQGGIYVRSTVKQDFDLGLVQAMAREFRFQNAEIVLQEKLSLERLADAFAKNRVYLPALFVANKIDLVGEGKTEAFLGKEVLGISAQRRVGLERLREAIWKQLGLVRIYLRKPGGRVDDQEPLIMRQGQILAEVLSKLGSDFVQTKNRAKIWGSEAKYPGQEVSLSAPVWDGMEVMFI